MCTFISEIKIITVIFIIVVVVVRLKFSHAEKLHVLLLLSLQLLLRCLHVNTVYHLLVKGHPRCIQQARELWLGK